MLFPWKGNVLPLDKFQTFYFCCMCLISYYIYIISYFFIKIKKVLKAKLEIKRSKETINDILLIFNIPIKKNTDLHSIL